MGAPQPITPVQYWLDHVNVALWLSYGYVPIVLANILLQGRGGELKSYAAVVVWLALCVVFTCLPWRRIIERGRVEWVTLIWSVTSALLVTAGLLLRGEGLKGTTVLMYMGAWLFATMSYRPWYVSCVAVVVLGCTIGVHMVNPVVPTAEAVILILLLLLFWPVGSRLANYNHRRLQTVVSLNERLREIATVDGLTGCLTHQAFHEKFTATVQRAAHDDTPVAVVMADLDHFKEVNDRHGHAAGDAVLAATGKALRAAVRSDDFVGRVGGEEFAIVLSDVGPSTVSRVVDRIRRGIEAIDDPLPVGVSMGVVSAVPDNSGVGHPLLRQADSALYSAKHGGRGRTVWSAASEPVVEENRPTVSTPT